MLLKFVFLHLIALVNVPLFLCTFVDDDNADGSGSEDYSKCGVSTFEPAADPLQGNGPKIGTNHVYKGHAVRHANALPWMATLTYRKAQHCTATIIGSNHVLTAYHCVDSKLFPPHEMHVLYGSVNVSTQPHKLAIRSIIKHPLSSLIRLNMVLYGATLPLINYHNDLYVHDVAIIEVAERINFTRNVRPICLYGLDILPSQQLHGESEFEKTITPLKPSPSSFIVAGWGLTKPHCMAGIRPNASDQLMVGTLRMVGMEKCFQLLPKARPLSSRSVDHEMADAFAKIVHEFTAEYLSDKICLLADPSTTEHGDSGGPLMSKMGKNSWVQVGVTSGGTCDPISTDGVTNDFTPVDCPWVADSTNGQVKCKGW